MPSANDLEPLEEIIVTALLAFRRVVPTGVLAATTLLAACSTSPVHLTQSISLDQLARAQTRKVETTPSTQGGGSLRVTLAPGLSEAEMYDKPTFVVVPASFKNGSIEVDLMARLLPGAPALARGFVGVAYHIDRNADHFEAVYLRPTNGLAQRPPSPRDKRAVQWFAYPEWPFSRLRKEFPEGPYEVGADIAPERWMRLRLDLHDQSVVASIDGRRVLKVESRVPSRAGTIGLWVDIGTEAFFRNLRFTPDS